MRLKMPLRVMRLKCKSIFLFLFVNFFICKGFSQPYIDILNTSYQSVKSNYKDTLGTQTNNSNFLNVFIPVKMDTQNYFIARFYGEEIRTTVSSSVFEKQKGKFNTGLLALGWQYETKSKKWKHMLLAMPKLSSDFKTKVNSKDFQLGGYYLSTWKVKDNLKLKFGLYYNGEPWGSFFTPIISADWKVSKRFYMYGLIPTNYRFEYQIVMNKLFGGLAYKSYTRSYRLSKNENYDYVRNNEMNLKLFLEYYIAKKFVLFGEAGRMIYKGPQRFVQDSKIKANQVLYSATNPNFFFNVGLAYRIRFEF